jgi:hypothetical protein
MSWTDKSAIEVIKFLRDKFKIGVLIETGTFMGINAELHSKNFKLVLTCESVEDYYNKSFERLYKCLNVFLVKEHSPRVLKLTKLCKKVIYYLDAHFYNPKLPKNKRFVVLDELKTLKGKKDCIIIIHDFDNGLGHCVYDGIRLGMNILRNPLKQVNPNFHLYTNRLESCDIMKPEETDDPVMKDNLIYAWKTPRLTYRGILYYLPKRLTKKELEITGLRCL